VILHKEIQFYPQYYMSQVMKQADKEYALMIEDMQALEAQHGTLNAHKQILINIDKRSELIKNAAFKFIDKVKTD